MRPLPVAITVRDGLAGEAGRAGHDVVDRIRGGCTSAGPLSATPSRFGTVARLAVLLVDALARRHLRRAAAAALARFQQPENARVLVRDEVDRAGAGFGGRRRP